VAVFVVVELVECPLPKPSDEGYIETRLLEVLKMPASEFLEGASHATPRSRHGKRHR
jgi:hypothetical protein